MLLPAECLIIPQSIARTTPLCILAIICVLCPVKAFSTLRISNNRNAPPQGQRPIHSACLRAVQYLPPELDAACDINAKKSKKFDIPLPAGRELTKLELEFRTMILVFAEYTDEDIRAIPNPRFRALYEGVAASGTEPAVYRAFEVLFEDLVPLRIPGRMIFKKLRGIMETSKEKRHMEIENIVKQTGLPETEIGASRDAFLQIAEHKNGEAILTIDQLLETGIAAAFIELMGYSDIEDFVEKLDDKSRGKLNFEEFMIQLRNCSVDEECSLECDLSTILHEVVNRIDRKEVVAPPDERKRIFEGRFEHMVETFQQWQDKVPDGEGRWLDVLRGCFVGARNPKVVEALRIVYVDYYGLRVAGDLIFKLMKALLRDKSSNPK